MKQSGLISSNLVLRGMLLALSCILLTNCRSLASAEAPQQALRLTIQIDTTEFFEGQPVFFVMELANVGLDTTWVAPFRIATGDLHMSLVRSDGSVVPKRQTIVDEVVTGPWRGWPLPPGASLYETGDLQVAWGDNGPLNRTLFALNLAPGSYELQASFNPNASAEASVALITAVPVAFQVRSRTLTEETRYQEVVQLASMLRGPTQRSGFLTAMLDWVQPKIGTSEVDPLAAFLITSGLYVGGGAGLAPGPALEERIRTLQAIGARAQATRPMGAVLAIEAVKSAQRGSHSSWILEFLDALTGSLAGAVASEFASSQGRR